MTEKELKLKTLLLHAYKIKFMINNVQYNFKAKYNSIFEDFLMKNILNIINIFNKNIS